MQLDARDIELRESLFRIREVLTSTYGNDIFIEVLVNTHADAKKVEAFVLMSGLSTTIDKKDGHYLLSIRGFACCA